MRPYESTFGLTYYPDNGIIKDMALKPLFFVSSARKDLKGFPEAVQKEVGNALHEAQWGGVPGNAKPMKGFSGVSVMEIVERHNTDTYRAVYTVKFEKAIFVLHCFQKKSKHGIATAKQDVDLIEARLRDAREHYEERFGEK